MFTCIKLSIVLVLSVCVFVSYIQSLHLQDKSVLYFDKLWDVYIVLGFLFRGNRQNLTLWGPPAELWASVSSSGGPPIVVYCCSSVHPNDTSCSRRSCENPMEAECSKMQQIAAQPCVKILCYFTLVVHFSVWDVSDEARSVSLWMLKYFLFLLVFINEDCDVIVSAEVTSYLAGNVSCLFFAFYLFLCFVSWVVQCCRSPLSSPDKHSLDVCLLL